jgi:hypothetical protein
MAEWIVAYVREKHWIGAEAAETESVNEYTHRVTERKAREDQISEQERRLEQAQREWEALSEEDKFALGRKYWRDRAAWTEKSAEECEQARLQAIEEWREFLAMEDRRNQERLEAIFERGMREAMALRSNYVWNGQEWVGYGGKTWKGPDQ